MYGRHQIKWNISVSGKELASNAPVGIMYELSYQRLSSNILVAFIRLFPQNS